ncbi:MAG: FecR domain-containing protein [Prolixibacteraceae bacterium]
MEQNKHITDEEWEILARDLYDTGNRTAPLGSIGRDAAEADIAETAGKIDLYFRLKQFDEDDAFLKLRQKTFIQHRKPVFFLRSGLYLKIAAAIAFALIVASAGFLIGNRFGGDSQHAGVAVDQYGNSLIKLPDGSAVTLNHGTRIDYPDEFRNDIREILIEGEAFFEVSPDPERPFVIHAGKATIKVLGTSFNVNAYPANESVEVIVETGKVQITKTKPDATGDREIILDPGERGVLMTINDELRKSRNDNPNFLAWKTREFVFVKTSLKEVIEQLNKVYHVQVKAKDTHVEKLLLTARFEGRSLDFILKVISMTHNLQIEQVDEDYVLERKFMNE